MLEEEAAETGPLLGVMGTEVHAIKEIGAVDAVDVADRIAELELTGEIIEDEGGGRGGECHDGSGLEEGGETETGEEGVFGAEAVPPLRDAVRLIDGDEADGAPELFVEIEAVAGETFGGEIEDHGLIGGTGADAREGVAGLFWGLHGMETGGGDASMGETFDLILHEGDEGGDNEDEGGADKGKELEADGFTAASGHDAKDILTVEGGFEDLPLSGTEGGKMKMVLQEPQGMFAFA